MYFAFKTQPEDFIVEELLPFQLSGKGEFLYVFFEKKLVNTMEVLLSLCQMLGLKRRDIGIAGLKDKAWITRQRLSISQKALNACGGSSTFFDSLKQKVAILAAWRHHAPLAIGKNGGNHFTIRLRGRAALPPEAREQLEQHLQKSKKIWFPNAFWIQRFWKGNKNFKKAKKIFSEGHLQDHGYQVKFMLQAFGSMRFNELVIKRRKEWAFVLDWDIMVNGRNALFRRNASAFWLLGIKKSQSRGCNTRARSHYSIEWFWPRLAISYGSSVGDRAAHLQPRQSGKILWWATEESQQIWYLWKCYFSDLSSLWL